MLKLWTVFVLTSVAAACSSSSESELSTANRPKGYQTICRNGENCVLQQKSSVAFGASGKFVYKSLEGKFLCVAETFGDDPFPEKRIKECSVPVRVKDLPALPPPVTVPPTADAGECIAGATIKDKTIDCAGQTIGLSCDADSESQPPVLTLINASVKNLRIAAGGGSDGIHCTGGNCTLENVVWEDICEDAATHKSNGGTMTIIGGSAFNSADGPGGKPDKVFQHNSRNSTTIITGGFTLKGQHGKLWRSCGDCKDNGGPRNLVIDDVVIEGDVSSGIAGANQNYGDRVSIRNLRIKHYSPGKPSICDEYVGVSKGHGSSRKLGEFFGTQACDVNVSDVFSF